MTTHWHVTIRALDLYLLRCKIAEKKRGGKTLCPFELPIRLLIVIILLRPA